MLQYEHQKIVPEALEFLWLDLTRRCNLQCSHCYNNSGPDRNDDVLTGSDFVRLLDEAARLGCRRVQFIGGEPTLHPDIVTLIKHAANLGFAQEIFTNATRISERLYQTIKACGVHVAASFYSDQADVHDTITGRRGSYFATLRNFKRIVADGIRLRVGIIGMSENTHTIDATRRFLTELGIANIGVDHMRPFGRGDRATVETSSPCDGLCGQCWKGKACVGPDGTVLPCIMAEKLPFGNISDGLETVLNSPQALDVREIIFRAFEQSEGHRGRCEPYDCQPFVCAPDFCHPDSSAHGRTTGTYTMNCSPACIPPSCVPQDICEPHSGCSPMDCSPDACVPDLNCAPYRCGPENN